MTMAITQPACLRRARAPPRMSRKTAKPTVPPSIGTKTVEYASTTEEIQKTPGSSACATRTIAPTKNSRETRNGSFGKRRATCCRRDPGTVRLGAWGMTSAAVAVVLTTTTLPDRT